MDERRRRVYCLTEEGQRVRNSVRPYWERAQNRMRRELGESDWELLGNFADRLTQAAIRAELTPSQNGKPQPSIQEFAAPELSSCSRA